LEEILIADAIMIYCECQAAKIVLQEYIKTTEMRLTKSIVCGIIVAPIVARILRTTESAVSHLSAGSMPIR
jgi:hypothetical protein